ncbi:MAG: hypothetical protein GF388_12135 [Candidatus Aegiribacteria sp.]|nr:hypothetical protein [Candidatus Aegiribacteria sp.]MBD3295711.1 hypothetical protein [Candidatus Fermentibacteria bacterium]
MITANLVVLLINIAVPVYNLPAVSDGYDAIAVLLEDGLLPEEPWEGLTSHQREEFWTLACSGMMVQRAAWSGYVIICPPGTGEQIAEMAVSLASAETVSDNSNLRTGLQLTPVSECSSTVILFDYGGYDQPPEELPLRSSRWLAQDPDTLILTSEDEGTSFFWTGHPENIDLSPSAWRGTGSELVPAGENSQVLTHSCVHGSVPSNLTGIVPEAHPLDDDYMAAWGSIFTRVDSLIADIYPPDRSDGHLLWIRGQGAALPWRTASSPSPPPSAHYRISMPDVLPENYLSGEMDVTGIPNAISFDLPGDMEDPSRGSIIEAVLERIIMRDVLPEIESPVHFDVRSDLSGSVQVWITEQGGQPDTDMIDDFLLNLSSSVLVPPGAKMVHNAWVRASILQGVPIDSIGVRETSMELMQLLFTE